MKLPRSIKWQTLVLTLFGSAGVVLLGIYAFNWLRTPAQQAEEEPAARAPVPVRIATAELRTLTPTVDVIGVVQPDPERHSIVSAATTGIIEKLLVREGTRVVKNDPIIQLDERPARMALSRAEAAYARLIAKPLSDELTQARLLVEKTEAAHGLAKSRLQKARDVREKSPELVPDLALLDEQRNEQATRAEWETAQAQLRLLEHGPRDELRRESQVEVAAAKLQLDFCQVRAPIAGEVVEIKALVGQRADVGTPLVTILDSSEVLVQARIPNDRLAGVLSVMQAADQTAVATIHCSAFANEICQATGGWLGEQTEAQTSDVPIKLRVPNLKGLLRPGMTVQVRLHEQSVKGVAVPEVAITVNEEGQHVVTVVRDGKAEPTDVTITSEGEPELRAEGWVRILSGLKPGDEVAVENGYALPKDTPVKILPPLPAKIAIGTTSAATLTH